MNQLSRNYLHSRGITDEVIDRYRIDGDGTKIVIPVKGFNKYRTHPEKKYFYDKGYNAALFGTEQLNGSTWCVLAEGELDALRLASIGIPAVSGTGGAGTFKDEWIAELPRLVFICYDTDKVGKDNALKIHWRISGSKIIDLPEGKDITEYLQNHSKEQFEELITKARKEMKPLPVFNARVVKKPKKTEGTEIERANQYPIENLVKFVRGKAPCIWHKEKTPSMHLYPDNHVYCFGCSKGGDAIAVYMTLKEAGFEEAVKSLNCA